MYGRAREREIVLADVADGGGGFWIRSYDFGPVSTPTAIEAPNLP